MIYIHVLSYVPHIHPFPLPPPTNFILFNISTGKTTQIPQFIHEENPNAKIVICQPRRLAAVGVATRVAEELASNPGDEAGYMVRGNTKATARTRLVFCTYGVLLRRLQDDPDLKSVDYIVLDEVHERGMESDFTLALLMSALSRRTDLRLVLMSATISTEKFANYLGNALLSNHHKKHAPAPVLEIPGFTFPVDEYFKADFENIARNIPLSGGGGYRDRDHDYDDYSGASEEVSYERIGGWQRKGDLDYDLLVRSILLVAGGGGTSRISGSW